VFPPAARRMLVLGIAAGLAGALSLGACTVLAATRTNGPPRAVVVALMGACTLWLLAGWVPWYRRHRAFRWVQGSAHRPGTATALIRRGTRQDDQSLVAVGQIGTPIPVDDGARDVDRLTASGDVLLQRVMWDSVLDHMGKESAVELLGDWRVHGRASARVSGVLLVPIGRVAAPNPNDEVNLRPAYFMARRNLLRQHALAGDRDAVARARAQLGRPMGEAPTQGDLDRFLQVVEDPTRSRVSKLAMFAGLGVIPGAITAAALGFSLTTLLLAVVGWMCVGLYSGTLNSDDPG
jgi:hypothetical protein